MAQLTKEQRIFVVSKYLETKSYNEIIRAFRVRFPDRVVPYKTTIQRNVKKYMEHGTSLNLNKQFSGRRRTARSVENIEEARIELQNNPGNFSLRRNNLELTRSSLQRIIKNDLKWHPFKILTRHQLLAADFQRRVAYSNWFERESHNPRFLRRVVIGDEACFSMNGKVSTQNVRMYAPKGDRPDFNYDVNQSREKLNVWSGICGNGCIIGPFFFEGSVTGRKYLEMLNTHIFQAITHCVIVLIMVRMAYGMFGGFKMEPLLIDYVQ